MKFRSFYIALAALAPLLLAAPAKADPKPWIWSWGPSHFINQHFTPYPDDPRHPYNSQWDSQNWQPENWYETTRGKEKMKLIRDYYFADILRKQTTRRGMPAVEIGPGFYQLGSQDKRRVLATIDDIYKVTSRHDNALFIVYDWRTHEPIGVYTKYGLQMQ
jgi:hypothetical protein